ncbi:hypothetical protein GRF59_20350 [Paenibacillus sp. HJL G12]|uniref:Uncharacterized protein n=1 Tax=Paenibacillus dendrobii TaxID=2691084 RepID=A0A7X3IM07_9BACL|nr:S-layer homology domain-containing protein [Paenibacillus dendrobii]MWV45973.1 hypothetical protein [Paenibacillus dendrobii]
MKKWGRAAVCLLLVLTLFPGYSKTDAASGVQPWTAVPQISAGYQFGLSLISSGTVWTWGANNYGQLGVGDNKGRLTPVQVKNLDQVTLIEAGIKSAYAMKKDGSVWAWGDNEHGQLGIGTTTDAGVPQRITGLNDVISMSSRMGYHALALKNDGTVWAWGLNNAGQVGDGTMEIRTAPVQVSGLSDVVAVSAGGYHSLALQKDGTVWAWGYNGEGELGNETLTDSPVPVQVHGLTRIKAISAGNYHNIALDEDGHIWTWGRNSNASLGPGFNGYRQPLAQLMDKMNNVKAIQAGMYHSLFQLEDGTVMAFGLNNYGQLGNGESTGSAANPVKTMNLTGVKGLAAGGFSSYALTADGKVWGWGYGSDGEMGNGGRADKTPLPMLSRASLDTTPPYPAQPEITVTNVTKTGLTLFWNQAADNWNDPELLEYQVYQSDKADIQTASAMKSKGVPIGDFQADVGHLEIKGLEPGKTYYFNVLVQDLAGNQQAYAMQQATTQALPKYQVSYNGRDSTSGNPPQDANGYEEGNTVIVLGNTGDLQKEGFSFTGWSMNEDGSGTIYAPGDSLTIGSANMMLYPVWTSVPDTAAPRVAAYFPESGAGNIRVDQPLQVTFNEKVQAVTGKQITIRKSSDGMILETILADDAQKIGISGTGVVITPAAHLEFNTAYEVQIEAGAFQDEAGNAFAGIAPGEWHFMTAGPEAPSSDARLGSLRFIADDALAILTPAFDKDIPEYQSEMSSGDDRVKLMAEPLEEHASVTVSVYDAQGGEAGAPIPLDLTEGNILTVPAGNFGVKLNVTAQDGSTKVYVLNVSRKGTSPGGNPGVPTEPGGSPGEGNPGSSGSGNTAVSESQPPTPLITKPDIRINGKVSGAELSNYAVTRQNGRSLAELELNTAALLQSVAKENGAPEIVVRFADNAADDLTLRVTGGALMALEGRDARLTVETMKGNASFSAAGLRVSKLLSKLEKQLGRPVQPADVSIRLSLSGTLPSFWEQTSDDRVKWLSNPVGIKMTAASRDASGRLVSVEAGPLSRHAELLIPIPQGTDLTVKLTAAWVDASGTIRSVPTRMTSVEGKWYAAASILSGGEYSLLYHEADAPSDMRGHWASGVVQDLASRLILQPEEEKAFRPDLPSTRGDVISLMVRALGLPDSAEPVPYADIREGSGMAREAAAAQQYGLITGYGDGLLKPDQPVTREEAFVWIGRMLGAAGLDSEGTESEAAEDLSSFSDEQSLSRWARSGTAAAYRYHIIQGDGGRLLPKRYVTRAELAAMIQRALNAAGRIDG